MYIYYSTRVHYHPTLNAVAVDHATTVTMMDLPHKWLTPVSMCPHRESCVI